MAKIKVKRPSLLIMLLLLGWSALLIGIFSYSSPLYDFNYTGDNNNYLTVGKALMHGMVTYRDVFEQKGPYVYLLYGLASKISFTTFWGAALFEIIGLWLITLVTWKLDSLWFKQRNAVLLALASVILVLMEPYYSYGGTVEFWVYPAILSALLVVCQFDQGLPELPKWQWIFQGFLVGVIFLAKYSLLGTWIAFFGGLAIWLILQKNWREFGRMIGWAGLGFSLSTIPWLLYFAWQRALPAFIRVYFIDNLTLYSKNRGTPLQKLGHSGLELAHFLTLEQPILGIIVVLGLGFLIWQRTIIRHPTKWLLIVMMLSNALFALYGGQFGPYYDLAYFPDLLFCALLVLVGLKTLLSSVTKWRWNQHPVRNDVLFLIVLGGSLMLLNQNPWSSRLVPNNPSVTLHPTAQRQEPAQLQFGKIMRQQSQGRPTLLTFDFLENGFYLTAGAYPTVYFFEKNNIPETKLPAMLATGINAMKRKQVEWVVIATPPTNNWERGKSLQTRQGRQGVRVIQRNYRLVATHSQLSQGNPTQYWLFRSK
ncbi:ArnT family glycosyltransferase [Fructilactobacillus carniphilus]|uniref:Glycosyltransferase RgtA/B/C/D-like domain-containing protein n=1 Tax=Fructilactobacillus carniphilus TaxID=2940297 RepID=A0ABY5BXK0_9LACO|nr:hypothetical protein [Fructilactobacillus carniphilus]USS91235.1 hypothetical protein M3M37_03290 [Fructilactobacillus carniphilus]